MSEALDAGNITEITVWTIIIVIVAGFLLSLLITALVGRLIIAALVIVAIAYVWIQRNQIEHAIDQHKCSFTLAGVHLDPPDSLKKSC